ncbi:MAG: hypothetical protein WCK47_00875 [bacterium]|nr:hypothetical protein [Candidatus Sumerlaeota bacterium]
MFVGILTGCKSVTLGWKQITTIVLVVGTVVVWETANILFRYIGVE